jgi:hypothetical protein
MRGKRPDQVMTAAGEKAGAAALQARHEAVAVVLDFVQPARPTGRHSCGGRDAGLNETGGQDIAVARRARLRCEGLFSAILHVDLSVRVVLRVRFRDQGSRLQAVISPKIFASF